MSDIWESVGLVKTEDAGVEVLQQRVDIVGEVRIPSKDHRLIPVTELSGV